MILPQPIHAAENRVANLPQGELAEHDPRAADVDKRIAAISKKGTLPEMAFTGKLRGGS